MSRKTDLTLARTIGYKYTRLSLHSIINSKTTISNPQQQQHMQKTIFTIFCLLGMLTILNTKDTKNSFRILGEAGDYCDFIVTSLPITFQTPSGSYSTTYKAATGEIITGSNTTAYAESDLSVLGMNNSISFVSYSGTNCNVRLQFFTKTNFIGNWIRFSVYKSEGQLTLNNYWSTHVLSYKFYYP